MRLNLFIAKSGCCSRRYADLLIKNGKVEINGKVVREYSLQVDDRDKVKVEDKEITLKELTYILFNKPIGVTTTLYDRYAEKKVIDFIPQKFKGVYPVGRLDKDSSGLLIITNDGSLCYKVTHPKFAIEKEYLVKVEGKININYCQTAKRGVVDKGDFLKVKDIKILKKEDTSTVIKVIAQEGKKRHLRRLFHKLGFEVLELKRSRIGGLLLGDLALGEYKEIAKDKLYSLLFGN